MSYSKIECPGCNEKITVSYFFLKFQLEGYSNSKARKAEIAKSLCNCFNKVKNPTKEEKKNYSSRLEKIINKPSKTSHLLNLWTTMTYNNIFINNVEKKVNTEMITKQNGIMCKIFFPYKYIPENRLSFSYMGKFHETVKEIEKNVDNTKLNKKYILLKHKCHKDFKNLNEWNKFNFVPDYSNDHDSSYVILRALKEKDTWYLEFLADRLFSILDKKKEITLCRIPSSNKDKISGCDDLIKKLSSKSSLLIDGSKCLQRLESIIPAHKGGIRSFDQHIKTSKINNLNLIENKNILLIDDIKTSGTSIDAFTHMLLKAKPKTLTTFVFGITIGYDNN